MPIIKGNWYDPDGKPFSDDGQMQIGEKQGQRCRRKGHNTKRRRKPQLFPEQREFGYVSRAWKEQISAAAKLAWSRSWATPTNREGHEFALNAHRFFMNYNVPLFNAGFQLESNIQWWQDSHIQQVAILYYDAPSRIIVFRCDFYKYDTGANEFKIMFHQVKPEDINAPWALQFASHIGSGVCTTEKDWPDVQTRIFYIRCRWLPTDTWGLQFILRVAYNSGRGEPMGTISHHTIDAVPKVHDWMS